MFLVQFSTCFGIFASPYSLLLLFGSLESRSGQIGVNWGVREAGMGRLVGGNWGRSGRGLKLVPDPGSNGSDGKGGQMLKCTQ